MARTFGYCEFCEQRVTRDAHGSWIDSTDGDGCDNPSGVHVVDDGKRYNIVRHYYSASIRKRIIDRNLTLAEAQSHCEDPETSSSTCTNSVGRRRTRDLGPWFDGYEEV